MAAEPVFISIAFALGLLALIFRLPPMVGFLLAGFVLHGIGYESHQVIEQLGDLGVTLLLFIIGLKLRLEDLLRFEIWGGASIHLAITVVIFTLIIVLLSALKIPLFSTLDFSSSILIAFAISFSSTVFAVKVLEEKGQLQAVYGRLAIGILIMQDIFAVLFMTISSGKIPSIWALTLVLLPFSRPILYKILEKSGHGELLALFGLFMSLVMGAGLFSLLGLKADLGALIMGILLAPHAKSSELSKTLFYFKELLLIIFFLNIGLHALPNTEIIWAAVILTLILPVKSIIYYLIFNKFRYRGRTSAFTAGSLSNYSEFGLIVCAVGISSGMLDSQWIIVIAVALTISFLFAAPLNMQLSNIYTFFHDFLTKFEAKKLHEDDQLIDIGDAHILIFGMGRVGGGAYEQMEQYFKNQIIGIESNKDHVHTQLSLGKNVIRGDATDSDFWEKVKHNLNIELVLLAMPNHNGNLYTAEQLYKQGYKGKIAAVATFPDQEKELRALGVDEVYNFYLEAGKGFAEHLCNQDILKNKEI
ncbi:MAG: cation:proton antiporter [Gammaproteobacteria bacterium]|nr:cation:proton antiporter [Gammaproteobacteria bacterium]